MSEHQHEPRQRQEHPDSGAYCAACGERDIDPIVQAVAEALHATAREHRPTTGMQVASGATCACGYWTGSEAQGPTPSGWHQLLPHMLREAAEDAVAALNLPAIEREAKAEAERLRHLLGSHADGHLCTCEMIDPGVYHGENMHPPEWEQDPWCPTHPDVNYIKTEVAARLAAVEELAAHYEAEAQSEGYGGELWSTTGAAIRAALATGTTTNPQEADQ